MKLFTLMIALSLSLLATELQHQPYQLVKNEIGKGKTVMVEAGSTMCKACKEMGKLLYAEKQINSDRKIFFVNVGKEREAASALKIQMIPTQIIYDANGTEIDRHIGGFTAEELKLFLAKHKI